MGAPSPQLGAERRVCATRVLHACPLCISNTLGVAQDKLPEGSPPGREADAAGGDRCFSLGRLRPRQESNAGG
eukprot:195862-Alexandrium_andersonii.AAC.1